MADVGEVDDGAGNRNNMIVVKPVVAEKESEIDTHVMDQATAPVQAPEKTERESIHAPASVTAAVHHEEKDEIKRQIQTESEPESSIPVLSNEPEEVKKEAMASHVEEDVTAPIQAPEKSYGGDDSEEKLEQSPLFSHKSFAGERQDSKLPSLSSNEEVGDEPQVLLSHESTKEQAPEETAVEFEEFEDDEDFEDEQPPLFRHESFAPELTESAPLFEHESRPIDMPHASSKSVRSNSTTSYGSHRSRQIDANDLDDPSLERFPTDQAAIMAHLQRAETRLREDETSFDGTPASPSMASSRSFGAETSPAAALDAEMAPLSQVTSAQLDCITEGEEPTPEHPADVAEVQRDAPIEPPARKQSPKLSISPSHEPVRGPLTPPMTPIDEPEANDGFVETFETVHLKTPEKGRLNQDNATDNLASQSKTLSADTVSASESKQPLGILSSFWDWFSGLCGGRVQAT